MQRADETISPETTHEQIQTFVRIRSHKGKPNEHPCLSFENAATATTLISHANGQSHRFTEFTKIFDGSCETRDVQSTVASPLVDDFLAGKNCTVLVYGQTGSGKTFTMFGPMSVVKKRGTGLLGHTLTEILERVETGEASTVASHVSLSIVEVYNERIRDLLASPVGTSPTHETVKAFAEQNLQLFSKKSSCKNIEGKVTIRDCTERPISNIADAMALVRHAQSWRSTASTIINEQSSRGHCMARVLLKRTNSENLTETNSVFYFVDLAGSERFDVAQSQSKISAETKNINKSLSCLTSVVLALCERSKAKGSSKTQKLCVPYRNSKLTRLLKESLGGNAKTSIVLCCTDDPSQAQETLSTLRFGALTRNVVNRCDKNESMTMQQSLAKIKLLEEEVAHLRASRHVVRDSETLSPVEGHFESRVDNDTEALKSSSEDTSNFTLECAEEEFLTPEKQILAGEDLTTRHVTIDTIPCKISDQDGLPELSKDRSPTLYRIDVLDRYFPSPVLSPLQTEPPISAYSSESFTCSQATVFHVLRVCFYDSALLVIFLLNGSQLLYFGHVHFKAHFRAPETSLWSASSKKADHVKILLDLNRHTGEISGPQLFTIRLPEILVRIIRQMQKDAIVCRRDTRGLAALTEIFQMQKKIYLRYANMISRILLPSKLHFLV